MFAMNNMGLDQYLSGFPQLNRLSRFNNLSGFGQQPYTSPRQVAGQGTALGPSPIQNNFAPQIPVSSYQAQAPSDGSFLPPQQTQAQQYPNPWTQPTPAQPQQPSAGSYDPRRSSFPAPYRQSWERY